MRSAGPAAVLVSVAIALGVGARPAGRPGRQAAAPPASQPAATAPLARSPRNASYTIGVTLDPSAHLLDGRETLSWRNISAAPTSELRFHLYYNAWRSAASTFFREAALAGGAFPEAAGRDAAWTRVSAIRLHEGDGRTVDLAPSMRFIAPDDGNVDDRTVMSVQLPRTVAPGETIQIDIEWTARVPRTVARTGFAGSYYFIAQWFPKIGVLEDAGWNCHQFHASTEFFADYGVYDVSITVPSGWIVGASGKEQPAPPSRAASIGGREMRAWRFVAEDVHDFAWTTSPDYVERRESFRAPGLPPVEMRLLLQPEHVAQAARHFRATRAALRDYGYWFGAYPYPNITIVDPSWHSGAGGMEYPTLFTAGTDWIAPEGVISPEMVTVHECGHQFWYALVGNNEFEDAWLDEGLNTYATARVIEHEYRDENHESHRFFGGFVPYVFRDLALDRVEGDGIDSYRRAARLDLPSRPSWRYWPTAAGPLSYSKTALWLHTLENHLGWSTFRRCLATYFDRWKFRHPKPADFFQVVNEVSGQDLTWFFDQVYRDTRVFDYAVARLESHRAAAGSAVRTTVIVRRNADGVFPVDVVVRLADGKTVRERWDGRDPWKVFTWDRGAAAVSAEVDPDYVLALDVNRANNGRLAEPAGARAATRWTMTWMVWLQDLFLYYANLV